MSTTRHLLKEIPSSIATLVQWISPPAAGVLVSLTNNSESSLTYSFQESVSGTSWDDKTFTIGESEVSEFTLSSGSTHSIKVTSSQQLRLRVIGTDGTVSISILDPTPDSVSGSTTLYPYPT